MELEKLTGEWLSLLRACSQNMRKKILPLIGSVEAEVGYGVGAGGDIKKQIDIAAEDALISTLQEHKASCTLISEESGFKQIGSKPASFYVTTDPVDGTTNAIRGLPFVDISIAVSKKPYLRNIETALVADVLHNITYTAERGKGAHKNNEPIKPSDTALLEEAVIGVDLNSFKERQLVFQLIKLMETTKHLRHLGANALEMCYVADGTTDAFIDIRGKLRVTDMAAAQLILREAGGIITKPDGKSLNVPLEATQKVSFIAAANNIIYDKIHKLLQKSRC
jgi:myo-inositol-1(or 4)-monophosphatase